MIYTGFEFFTKDEVERSILISLLDDYHFEGYEETEESLKAFVPTEKIKKLNVAEILMIDDLGHIRFSSSQIEDKNWNEEWEKNFEPIMIAGRVGIRAPFHEPLNAELELVIEPKMSFGTGHHATTAGVIELMLQEDFKGRSVLDFGSGTGVLAILAEKMGAAKVLAIDHEEWAFNNCVENVERNECTHIQSFRGSDILVPEEKFDIILANINRNVILDMIKKWNSILPHKGILIVSGFLRNDELDIKQAAENLGLSERSVIRKEDWSAITFSRS
ncbi:MAG: 50S ribosomal protein L11 methyltransferase [Bacteroidetes bacterium]|nr:50S ribosomal protein L11 methyltransferase [Bacteroidota bacterium]